MDRDQEPAQRKYLAGGRKYLSPPDCLSVTGDAGYVMEVSQVCSGLQCPRIIKEC